MKKGLGTTTVMHIVCISSYKKVSIKGGRGRSIGFGVQTTSLVARLNEFVIFEIFVGIIRIFY